MTSVHVLNSHFTEIGRREVREAMRSFGDKKVRKMQFFGAIMRPFGIATNVSVVLKDAYLIHVNTSFGQRILRYKGTQLWNRLPNNLSNNTASQSFRNMLKLLLICDPLY